MSSQGTVIFLHGLESGPDGFKIQQMRATAEAMGWYTLAPDGRFSRDPVQRAGVVLSAWPREAERVYLVGSSLGGFVAASIAAQLATDAASSASQHPTNLCGMLLLCPAFDLPGYPLDRPAQGLRGECIQLIHGCADVVVPLSHSQRAATAWGADLLVVDDDHSLHSSIATICEVLAQRLACAVTAI
ncbi:MAG: YqiA/YcfP family alpha/beta fold hydrolase [Paraperlucidibaca sp.]